MMIGHAVEYLLRLTFWSSVIGAPVIFVACAAVELRARWRRTAWIVDTKPDGPLAFPPDDADPGDVVHEVSRWTYIQERLETGYPRARCGQSLWTITAPGRRQWSEQPLGGRRFDCPRCHGVAPRHMYVHEHSFGPTRR